MLKITILPGRRSIVAGVSILLTAVVGITGMSLWHNSTNAVAGGVVFEHFATHPYASKTGYDRTSTNYYTGQALCTDGRDFCPAGQTLVDMGFTADGQLVAGYGDWNSNVDSFGVAEGGIYVVPLDVTTNTWGSSPIRAGSEAITRVREIDGALYIPTTDPSDKTATGQSSSSQSGYVTNEGGTWRFVNNNSGNVHTFDVAKLGGAIFTFGSNDWNGASRGVASSHISTDNGVSWNWSTTDDSTPGDATDFERYYWGVALGGKVYTHGAHILPTQPPYKIYDNGQWQTANDTNAEICSPYSSASKVEVLGNHIVCTYSGGLKLFDGTNTTTKALPSSNGVKDFYVRQNVLYILTGNNKLYKLSGVDQDPVFIGSAGSEAAEAQTLAVYDDYVYLGGAGGEIWRSRTSMSDAPDVAFTPQVDQVLPFSVTLTIGERVIVIRGSDFGTEPTVTIGGQAVEVVSATHDSISVKIDVDQFSEGFANVEVTHKDGAVGQKSNALRFVPPAPGTVPAITSIDLEPIANDKVELRVSGTALTSSRDDYWAVGLRKKIVSLNGVELAACVDQQAYQVLKSYYDPQFITTNAPCYNLIDYNVATNAITPLISSGGLTIVLPSNHSASAHGTIRMNKGAHGNMSINTSNTFTY